LAKLTILLEWHHGSNLSSLGEMKGFLFIYPYA